MLSTILETFAQASPVSVMAQSLMVHTFCADSLDELFEKHSRNQKQKELLFSAQVDLMSLVVCGIHPSIHAAYREKVQELSVSTTALYKKLQGIEVEVSQALVRETATNLGKIIAEMAVEEPSLVMGYPLRIIDGTCLGTTDHRPKAIRQYAAKALPGKALVVLDPQRALVTDVFPCEDGHSQERAMFSQVLETVKDGETWVADRNFCTAEFLVTLHQKQACFVIRQHGCLGWQPLSELEARGETKTGRVFEQRIAIRFGTTVVKCRRIVLKLFKPTRDKELEMAIVTNVPSTLADASLITRIYQDRWTIETLFQTITKNFDGEIQTLAYPKAALFSYCMALVAYNILATLKAALAAEFGWGKIEAGLSDFYLVDEIQGTYRGMTIAVPASDWETIADYSLPELVVFLRCLATRVNLKRFRKSVRGPKKKRPPLIVDPRHRHLSTARKLREYASRS